MKRTGTLADYDIDKEIRELEKENSILRKRVQLTRLRRENKELKEELERLAQPSNNWSSSIIMPHRNPSINSINMQNIDNNFTTSVKPLQTIPRNGYTNTVNKTSITGKNNDVLYDW